MASGSSELSGGRFTLDLGAGVLWDEIMKLGVERRTPGEAVRLFEESIMLGKLLTGGVGEPVQLVSPLEEVRIEDWQRSCRRSCCWSTVFLAIGRTFCLDS